MEKSVSDQLVNILVECGVKRVYSITGDSLNNINNAVHKNENIEWVHVRHEETAAYAAGAEAQLTGNISCCAGSSGPGHVHLINGLYDANRSSAPVLAIASTCPSTEYGTQYFQETDTRKLFDDCSIYNQLATNPTQLARMLQGAIQNAYSRSGVAVLALPSDLTFMDANNGAPIKTFKTNPRIIPNTEELNELAQILNDKDKNVTLFCGIGCADAHDQVIALSDVLKAPVVYTLKGKMCVEYDNPNKIGLTGFLGLPSGYAGIENADIILMLGTNFPYTAFLPSGKIIIQIDKNTENLGKRTNLTLGLTGTVKDTINELLPLLNSRRDDEFLIKHLKMYNEVLDNLKTKAQYKGTYSKINPELVMTEIDKNASPDAIFTVDTGMNCIWTARYINATQKRNILFSANHGSMANALPQAIGAAFACPEREIIAVCGDGGLSICLGDIETIVQIGRAHV